MAEPEKTTSFKDTGALRAWFDRNHASKAELFIRCFKTHAQHRGVTYKQALDEALCYGWIDGVRHSLDEDSFSQRFTPRKPTSYWSLVNIKRAQELVADGRMTPVGLAAFNARRNTDAVRYSFESRTLELAAPLEKKFRARKRAWTYFEAQPPGYRRLTVFWVMDAKKDETRLKRLDQLIECSEQGRRIGPLEKPAKRKSSPDR